jgi:hypothetical protein
MAVEFLRNRKLPLPEELIVLKAGSVRAWLLTVTNIDPHGEDANLTRYLAPDKLPPEVDFDIEDLRILACLDEWPAVPRARKELLILRMAVDHVRHDYGGAVPAGLVSRTVRAATAARPSDDRAEGRRGEALWLISLRAANIKTASLPLPGRRPSRRAGAGNDDRGAPVSTTQAVRETRVRVGARARSDPKLTG